MEVTKENWYKQQDCRRENNSETVPHTDVLVCGKFGGTCGLIRCINLRHNRGKAHD